MFKNDFIIEYDLQMLKNVYQLKIKIKFMKVLIYLFIYLFLKSDVLE